jgi:hypothetical protein
MFHIDIFMVAAMKPAGGVPSSGIPQSSCRLLHSLLPSASHHGRKLGVCKLLLRRGGRKVLPTSIQG